VLEDEVPPAHRVRVEFVVRVHGNRSVSPIQSQYADG
jgi:hypothetical protein